MDADYLPTKAYFTLKELLPFKGVSYQSACHRKWLQPNSGKPDSVVSGNNVWKRDTVVEWLQKDDDALKKEAGLLPN